MLTQVETFVSGVTAPDFPVTDGKPSSDPIQIRDIEGLGPVAASVNTTQYGSVPGEFLNGSSTGKRNIILHIGMNPDWGDFTYEALRMILYSYFMPESPIRLVFSSTHLPQVQIQGIVESCEPDIFSKDPEMVVSIICPSPYFVAVNNSSVQGLTTAFADTTKQDVFYEGSVAVGYTLDVVQDGDSGPTISNAEIRVINNTPTLQLMDVTKVTIDNTKFFRLSTVEGNKFAQQIPLPSGLPTNLLGVVVPGSPWAPLQKGINKFQVQTATPGQAWTLSYYALYGGL